MAAPVRTNQVNQVIRHTLTTFGAVVMNVNKRSVSADARAYTPNYLLGISVNSKRTVEGYEPKRFLTITFLLTA